MTKEESPLVPDAHPATFTWQPSLALLVVEGAAGAALLTLAVLASTPASRAAAGTAGLLLLALTVRDASLRPVVAADHSGLHLVDGLRRRCFTWSQVDAIRASRTTRRAAVVDVLEIDVGDLLVLIPRRRLGEPCADVARRLCALRGQAQSASPPSQVEDA